jgi:hypothetical protein
LTGSKARNQGKLDVYRIAKRGVHAIGNIISLLGKDEREDSGTVKAELGTGGVFVN